MVMTTQVTRAGRRQPGGAGEDGWGGASFLCQEASKSKSTGGHGSRRRGSLGPSRIWAWPK